METLTNERRTRRRHLRTVRRLGRLVASFSRHFARYERVNRRGRSRTVRAPGCRYASRLLARPLKIK